MKKILLFLMFALFCVPWVTNAQQTSFTVCNGGNTNSYVPIYSLYADYGTRSQFIFPADLLEDMVGGTIQNITFYNGTASINYNQEFTVYMLEVDYTTFASTALVDWNSMTEVFQGTLTVSDNEMSIELQNPYPYQGENLMIGIQVTTWGTTCPSASWQGENQTGRTGLYNNANSSHTWGTTVSGVNFLPKTTFTYTPGSGPICEKPESLDVEDLNPRAASLTWTGGSGVYNVEVNGQIYASELEDMRINLENLTPATNYTVRVQSVCRDILDSETGEPKVSGWKSVSFTTPCEAISTYPWTENFDSYTGTTSGSTNNLPMCYNYINGTTYSSYSGYPVIYNNSGNSNSGNNHLYLYSYYASYGSYTYTDIYAILPEMEGLDGMMLTLYAKAYNANSSFTVGMMSDPTDATTFDPIDDTKTPSTTEYEKFTFILGVGHYVAFKMEPANSSSTNRGIRIDDIMIDEVPTCTEPTDLVHTGSTTHTAELSWTNGSEDQTAWQICLNGNENNLIMADGNPFTIENLDASSTYTAKVRAYCSETDQSYWSNEISFSTECEAISTLPWNENFNAYTAEATSTTTPSVYPDVELPVCWQFLNRSEISSAYPQAFLTSSSTYAVSGNCLFFKSSSETPLYAVLPEFAEDIANLMLTFTYRNEGTTTSNGTLIVGYMTDPADATTFTSVLTCGQTTTLTEMEVLFADAPAGSYIAFKYQGGSSNNYYLSIDDIMVGLIPSCMKPSALMLETPSSRTAHTATLKWTNGTEDQDAWQIAYSTEADFDPNDYNPVDVTSNPTTISGLAANTTYYAYVRANCGNDGFSAWCKNKASFTTLVGNAVPTGLTYDPASLTSREVSVSWTGVATNDLHESFDLYYSTESTMPEELDEHSLIAGITESTYHFEDLTPETQYYVWVRDNCGNDGYSNWSSSINFTMASDCQIPDGLAVEERTNTSVVISWNGYGLNEFNLKYSADGENWETIENVENPYTLTGLTGNTTYQVEVQPLCNPDEWSDAMSCITACDAVTEFPWNEDFEGFTASSSGVKLNDNCWENVHIEGTGTYFFEVYSSTTATGGNSTKMLRLHDMSAGTMTKLMLPEMNIPTGVNHQFILDVYRNVSGTSYPEEGIRVFASTDGEIEGATEMAFISRNCTVSDNNLIPSEEATGWYTYELPIPFTGTCFIILRGESKYGSATYMDNFIVKEIPSCLKPTAPTAANITSNTAELSWTANSNEQAWTVYYKKTTEEEYMSVPAESNPFTLESLDAASNYEYYVVANCSADDASEPSVTFTFATECEVLHAIGYTENFDSYTVASSYTAPSARVLPLCWNAINTTTYSTYTAFPTIYYYSSTNYANSTPNSLKLYSYYSSYSSNYDPQPQYAILPEMEGLAGTQVKLMARGYNATSTFKIGTMSDPTDAGTFTMIAEQTLTTAYPDEPFEYIVPANCTDSYLAIMVEAANSSRTANGVYIDDIAIVEVPSCFKPTDLAAVATTNSATLSWTANSEETEWTIYYKEVTNEPADYIEVSGVTENPYLLDNVLDAATQYEFYVVANCSADDASEPSAVYEFTTPCEAITITDETPYTQDFESPVVTTTYSQVGVMPNCWDNYPVNVSASAKILAAGAQYNYAEEGQVLYFYGNGNNYALLPVFTNDLNTLQISFKWATESSSNGTLTLGYITDEDEDLNSFTEIKTFAACSESYHVLTAETVGLHRLPANAARLLFKWSYNGQWGCNIDDVEVSLAPPYCYVFLNDNNEWVQAFDNLTQETPENGFTGVTMGNCWTWTSLVTDMLPEDWVDTMPQLFYREAFASSSNYSLRMSHRGIYAMPELDESIDSVQQLKMSFFIRQPFKFYILEIGVMDDPTDPETFTTIGIADNGTSTSVENFECNFSNYRGTGRFIAFKNVITDVTSTDIHSTNYIDDLVLSLYENTCSVMTMPFDESFDEITTLTTPRATGFAPKCWDVVQEDVILTPATAPQVYYKESYASSGKYSLRMSNRCIFAMPELDPEVEMNTVNVKMYVRQPNMCYQLEVGVWDEQLLQFTPLAVVNNSGQETESFECNFTNYSGNGRRIAFRNTLNNGANYDYSYNYLDDVHVDYYEPWSFCDNYIESLPYDEDFDGVTQSTIAATGAKPECWEMVKSDVEMSAGKNPQVYYKESFATSGKYTLRMADRCVFAMPELSSDIELNTVLLTMNVRQPNKCYQLEVGVWEYDDNAQTWVFVPVETINNTETDMTSVSVDFSNYTGNGGRIAFRNTLNGGARYNYSYNYIDDLVLNTNEAKIAEISNENISDAIGVERYLESIAVYPNPTVGELHIGAMDVQKVECYNQMGQLVAVYDNESDININSFADGVYTLRITVPQGVTMRKVVKK